MMFLLVPLYLLGMGTNRRSATKNSALSSLNRIGCGTRLLCTSIRLSDPLSRKYGSASSAAARQLINGPGFTLYLFQGGVHSSLFGALFLRDIKEWL